MKYNTLAILLALSVLTIACDDKRTTKSGVEVNILEKGEGTTLVDSTVLQVKMRYVNSNGNEQWNSEKGRGLMPLPYNKAAWDTTGMIYEALAMMNVGDSASFEVPTKDLFENSFRASVPDSLDIESSMIFYVKILTMHTPEEFQAYQKEEYEKSRAEQAEQRAAEQAARLAGAADLIKADGEAIDKYLAENGITGQTTESGLRYVITQEGSGPNAEAGKNVSVHYSGTLMDGTKFDSSYDRGQPFQFVLGQGRVIAGWDEGIALLNKGAKATLYIPSSLGYGERATGKIVANSILKFDVELVDFK
jgi:FKBP-type peptidyl-prolyl cis-trans isomerase